MSHTLETPCCGGPSDQCLHLALFLKKAELKTDGIEIKKLRETEL